MNKEWKGRDEFYRLLALLILILMAGVWVISKYAPVGR